MLGLTGRHAGGKTVTELAVLSSVYLAQSGLPVFGKNFRLNVKRMMGLVFIERGDGSTCELLLKKTLNVLKALDEFKGEHAVVILDEVGTGTQEISGYELGKDLLVKLSQTNVSVLFSTQILKLAQFAESNLGAQCLQVDEHHRLLPGIGDGGMKDLRTKMGLNKYLN